MPIKRCTEQKSITLEAFYNELLEISNGAYPLICKRMLIFLEIINELFHETILWAHTSHARLVLHKIDDLTSSHFVTISNAGTAEYYFEYLIPKRNRPWENAMVRGEAKNLEEAKKYLLIAMRESEGWVDNKELDKLLKEHL